MTEDTKWILSTIAIVLSVCVGVVLLVTGAFYFFDGGMCALCGKEMSGLECKHFHSNNAHVILCDECAQEVIAGIFVDGIKAK